MEEILKIIKIQHKEFHTKIFLDSDEILKVPHKVASNYDLSTDRKIDKLEYKQLKEESERYTCKEKALSYLAVKDRSKVEIQNYLKKKGFSASVISEILTEISEAGYINDYEFALKYLSSQKRKKPVGVNVLKSKLQNKGIPKDKIKKALWDSGAYETDIDELYTLALKKYNSYKDKKNYKSRLYFFLSQRGFEKEAIEKVIKMVTELNSINK